MAQAADIQFVRDNLPTSTTVQAIWTDAKIGGMIDGGLLRERVLMSYWSQKAADTAELITISESGSTRELSTIHNNAVTQTQMWENRALQVEAQENANASFRPASTGRITRV